MKKHLFFSTIVLLFNLSYSQEVVDAVRYSQNNLTGTARFRAMGGAFGAVGGDLSSININPAGSAIFSNNQVTLSVTNLAVKNKATYFGTTTKSKENSLDINQIGGVFVFKNNDSFSDWKKFSISVNYEKTNNFDNSIFAAGTNPRNNISSYFLSYANANPSINQLGIPLGIIRNNNYFNLNYADQQAFLGYENYIINPLNNTDSNNSYSSNVPTGGNYSQTNEIIATGYNGKLSFNAATLYSDYLYLGLTLNSHFTDFRQNTSFYEENNNANSNTVDLVNTFFENEIKTYGSGFSLQLGAIAKVTKEIRAGLAYESPTWHSLNDEIKQNLISKVFNFTNNPNPDSSFINSNTNEPVFYDNYRLRTPGKINGSLAYIFNKKGLISIDYSYKDYSRTKFSTERDSRNLFVNNDISNQLKSASEIRVGGEYRIEALSLRAGYRFEQSPYKNGRTIGDLNSYSGGFGYNFGTWKLDFAYDYATRIAQQSFFSQGFTDGARINTKNSTASLTLSLEL